MSYRQDVVLRVGDGQQIAGSFKDATEDRQECGLTRTQRFRWYVILLGVSLFFGLALQFIPLCRHQTDEIRECVLHRYDLLCGGKFMLNGPGRNCA